MRVEVELLDEDDDGFTPAVLRLKDGREFSMRELKNKVGKPVVIKLHRKKPVAAPKVNYDQYPNLPTMSREELRAAFPHKTDTQRYAIQQYAAKRLQGRK